MIKILYEKKVYWQKHGRLVPVYFLPTCKVLWSAFANVKKIKEEFPKTQFWKIFLKYHFHHCLMYVILGIIKLSGFGTEAQSRNVSVENPSENKENPRRC